MIAWIIACTYSKNLTFEEFRKMKGGKFGPNRTSEASTGETRNVGSDVDDRREQTSLANKIMARYT
jgi:hypothetical protein